MNGQSLGNLLPCTPMLWWHFLLLSTVLVILAAEKNPIYSKHRLTGFYLFAVREKRDAFARTHLPYIVDFAVGVLAKKVKTASPA